MTRAHIPESVQTEVLIRSGRRCALCFGVDWVDEVTKVQLAHVDRDATRCGLDDVVPLCTRHHDDYDSTSTMTKGFLPAELRHYRDTLYAYVSKQREVVSQIGKGVGAGQTQLSVRLHIDTDFERFHSAYEAAVLAAVREVLQRSEGIEVASISKGSVILDITLSADEYLRVYAALLRGEFEALNVTDIDFAPPGDLLLFPIAPSIAPTYAEPKLDVETGLRGVGQAINLLRTDLDALRSGEATGATFLLVEICEMVTMDRGSPSVVPITEPAIQREIGSLIRGCVRLRTGNDTDELAHVDAGMFFIHLAAVRRRSAQRVLGRILLELERLARGEKSTGNTTARGVVRVLRPGDPLTAETVLADATRSLRSRPWTGAAKAAISSLADEGEPDPLRLALKRVISSAQSIQPHSNAANSDQIRELLDLSLHLLAMVEAMTAESLDARQLRIAVSELERRLAQSIQRMR